jgi:DNA-binding NarL/FixJ family response regulator
MSSTTSPRTTTRTSVFVFAADPVTQAGLACLLRDRAEIELIEGASIDAARVAVLAADDLGEETRRLIRATQRDGVPRVVIVTDQMDEASIFDAVEAGACGFVRRTEATPQRLAEVVRRAERGEGSVPDDMIGALMRRAGAAASPAPLDEREIEVLRLVAEGYDTAEIASQMAYSERTIKNVLHDVTSRLELRNRSHAVAWAIRNGLI